MNLIKKIVLYFIRRYKNEIQEIIEVKKINEAYCATKEQNAVLYEESSIINRQNKPSCIRIGNNSHIRGELMVMGYGGEIEIGDYCFIGEYSKIWSGEKIKIGNHVLISHNVNIIDTNSHEIDSQKRAEDFIALVSKGFAKSKGSIKTDTIIIEDNVWINFNAIISKGITIGEGAIIAAGSVVTTNVAPFTLVAGNPARFIKELK